MLVSNKSQALNTSPGWNSPVWNNPVRNRCYDGGAAVLEFIVLFWLLTGYSVMCKLQVKSNFHQNTSLQQKGGFNLIVGEPPTLSGMGNQ